MASSAESGDRTMAGCWFDLHVSICLYPPLSRTTSFVLKLLPPPLLTPLVKDLLLQFFRVEREANPRLLA